MDTTTVFVDVHYDGKSIWDGQMPGVPRKGEYIRPHDDREYKVDVVVWKQNAAGNWYARLTVTS